MSPAVVHTEISFIWGISPFVALQKAHNKIAVDMCETFRTGHRFVRESP